MFYLRLAGPRIPSPASSSAGPRTSPHTRDTLKTLPLITIGKQKWTASLSHCSSCSLFLECPSLLNSLVNYLSFKIQLQYHLLSGAFPAAPHPQADKLLLLPCVLAAMTCEGRETLQTYPGSPWSEMHRGLPQRVHLWVQLSCCLPHGPETPGRE